jgi:hypothetical protein
MALIRLLTSGLLYVAVLVVLGGCAGGGGRNTDAGGEEDVNLERPADLQATGVSATEIDSSWTDANDGETGFVLERSLDADFTSFTEIQIGEERESYRDGDLSAETRYHYRIKAVNGEAASPYSNQATAKTLASETAAFCTPLPMPTGEIITVTPSQTADLPSIVADAPSGSTILLTDGTYALNGAHIWMSRADVTIRSASGNRQEVVLDGNYASTEVITIAASDITIADITITKARTHAIHVVSTDQGDTSNTRIYNVRVVDPGQQGIKINPHGARTHHVDFGTIACCEILLTDQGRPKIWEINGSCYTGGIDAHRARGWIIRDNTIQGFWCENGLSEHAIHFWTGSRDTLVERNTIVDNARGIGFGLRENTADNRTYDDLDLCNGSAHAGHYDGIVRNNTVFAKRAVLFASDYGFDCGICMAQACGARIVHNSVASTQAPFSSIEWRFAKSRVELYNNLVTHNLRQREDAVETAAGNLVNAPLSLFVDGEGGDLHLGDSAASAIDKGSIDAKSICNTDMDGDVRDDTPDIGADEV